MSSPSTGPAAARTELPVDKLSAHLATSFDLIPTPEACRVIAQELGFLSVKKLRFTGTVTPQGKRGWALDGTLGTTIEQSCVVTLAPVRTRIDTKVARMYLPAHLMPVMSEEESEIPEDDSLEPLGETIPLRTVMMEAMALAAPDYPRAKDAALEQTNFAQDGVKPMTDEDTKPFAGLAALKDQLSGGTSD